MKNLSCDTDTAAIESDFKYYFHPLVNDILNDHLKTQEEMESACSFLFIVYAKQILDNQFVNACHAYNEEDLYIPTSITSSFTSRLVQMMLGESASLILQLLGDAGVLFICKIQETFYIKFTDNKFLEGQPFRDVSTKFAHDKSKQYIECDGSWIDEQLSLLTLFDDIWGPEITSDEFYRAWRDDYEDRIESGSSELSHETWEQMGKDAWQVVQLCNILRFQFKTNK